MATTGDLIVHRQFEADSSVHNYNDLVEESKNSHEEEARQELDSRMANSLADYQTRPSWTVEDGKNPNTRVYTLAMRIVFKP